MAETIFTKIIKGEIPSYKIYEDDTTYAFLDIHPIQPGHTLIVPKRAVEFVWKLSIEDYDAVMHTARRIAARIEEIFPDKKYVAMQVEGMGVPHAHVHVFPFSTTEEFHFAPDLNTEPDHAALEAVAKKLKF